MRVGQFLLLVVLGVAFFLPSQAQSPTVAQTPQRDPQALQILSRAFLAMGGPNLAAASDFREAGTIASSSAPAVPTGTFVAKARGNDLSFENFVGGRSSSFRILHGIGSLRRDSKTVHLPQYDTAGLSLDALPILGSWVGFSNQSTSVNFLGMATIDTQSCYQIQVQAHPVSALSNTNEHGNSLVFVDAGTGLIAAIRYKRTEGRSLTDRVTIENHFSDYREFGGVLVPMTVTMLRHGRPVRILKVSSFQVGNGFTDTDFVNEE